MSRDGMFGPMLRLTKKTNKDGNPYVAVLVTWFLVQIILLIGQVNKIAPIVTIFFLMAYAACDLACLGLDWASAPNFRPTFKYFSWQTALAGLISCIAVMFMVNPIWAIVSVAIAIILSAVSHYTAPRVAWGSLSQALIFHQVRKYALKINIREGYKYDFHYWFKILISIYRGLHIRLHQNILISLILVTSLWMHGDLEYYF